VKKLQTRSWWALWGVLAGAGGVVSNLLLNDQDHLSDEQMASGAGVIVHLDRFNYQAGVVAGWVAIAGLLVMAAGWTRIALRRRDEHLAWYLIPLGLVASASALIFGYGIKGMLAEYLDGGANEGSFSDEGLYTMFVINDNAPWVGWWGVLFAAAAVAWLSVRRRGSLPMWLGLVGALIVLHSTVVLIGIGAVAIAGLTGPIWLILASGWLLVSGEPKAHEA